MMPTILLRLVIVCNVLNSILAYFLPKKLRSFLTSYSFSSSSCSEPPASAAAQQGDLTRTLGAADPAHSHSHGPSDLDRVFRMFDRNGDGKITRAELTDSLEDLGIFIPERDLAAVIARVDADGDGCVDPREFLALYEDLMAKKPGGDEEEDMRDAFCVFDENGDGYITVEELQSVLDTLGVRQGRSVEDCRTMIRNVDVDGDGRVDYEEFKRMMRQGRVCTVAN